MGFPWYFKRFLDRSMRFPAVSRCFKVVQWKGIQGVSEAFLGRSRDVPWDITGVSEVLQEFQMFQSVSKCLRSASAVFKEFQDFRAVLEASEGSETLTLEKLKFTCMMLILHLSYNDSNWK